MPHIIPPSVIEAPLSLAKQCRDASDFVGVDRAPQWGVACSLGKQLVEMLNAGSGARFVTATLQDNTEVLGRPPGEAVRIRDADYQRFASLGVPQLKFLRFAVILEIT